MLKAESWALTYFWSLFALYTYCNKNKQIFIIQIRRYDVRNQQPKYPMTTVGNNSLAISKFVKGVKI